MTVVVIGLGNEFRRDDGIGPAVAAAVRRLGPADVDVLTACDDPAELLHAWDGAELTVIVDAAAGGAGSPGRLRRWTPGGQSPPAAVSSHGLDLASLHALGRALGRTPQRLVVFTVDAADVGHGVGLSPAVAAALPAALTAVMAEIGRPGPPPQDQGPKTPQPPGVTPIA